MIYAATENSDLQEKVWQEVTLGKSHTTPNNVQLEAGKRVCTDGQIWGSTHQL